MITAVVPGGWEFRWSWFFCFILFYAIWIFATTVLAARDPGPHERPTCAVAEIPHLEEPTFGLMLCFHCPEILDNSWTRHPSLSRALGPPLRSWSCQECTLSLQLPPGVCGSALTTAENRLLHSPSFRQQWRAGLSLSLSILSRPVVSFPGRGERTSEDRLFFFPLKPSFPLAGACLLSWIPSPWWVDCCSPQEGISRTFRSAKPSS